MDRDGRPDGIPLAPRPWARLLAVRDGAGGGAGPGTRGEEERLRAVLEEPVVRACLGAVDRSWRPRTLVHGRLDVSTVRTFLTRPAGSRYVLQASSGLGHPAWDVTCALAALDALDPRPRSLARSRSTFLASYLRGGGAQPLPAPPWRCVVALTQAMALVDQPSGEATSETVDALLARARAAAWWARRRTA